MKIYIGKGNKEKILHFKIASITSILAYPIWLDNGTGRNISIWKLEKGKPKIAKIGQ